MFRCANWDIFLFDNYLSIHYPFHTMNIINLTPHTIIYIADNGNRVVFPPSGKVARIRVKEVFDEEFEIDGNKIRFFDCTPVLEAVEDLPPYDDNFYIVSAQFRTAFPDRRNLISPGALVRDDKGNVTGCLSFHRN